DVVDLESDPNTQQKRKRDDVGKIQPQPDQHANLERDDDRNEQRYQGQRNVDPPPQRDKQDQRNQDQRQDAGLKECLYDGRGGLDHENRRAGGLRRDSADGRNEAAQDGIVVGIAFRRDLDPEPAVSGHPGLLQLRWKRFHAHAFGAEELSRLAQRRP